MPSATDKSQAQCVVAQVSVIQHASTPDMQGAKQQPLVAFNSLANGRGNNAMPQAVPGDL